MAGIGRRPMTHYDILGVPPSAPLADIRAAYRRRALQAHPDVATSDQTARGHRDADMARLNAAWNVLSNEDRRRAYDETLISHRDSREPRVMTDRVAPSDSPTLTSPRLVVLAAVCVLLMLGGVGLIVAQFTSTTTRTLGPAAPIEVGQCIVVRMGFATSVVECDGPHDGRVDRIIARSASCGPDQRRADATDGSHAICLSAD